MDSILLGACDWDIVGQPATSAAIPTQLPQTLIEPVGKTSNQDGEIPITGIDMFMSTPGASSASGPLATSDVQAPSDVRVASLIQQLQTPLQTRLEPVPTNQSEGKVQSLWNTAAKKIGRAHV